MEVNNEKRNGRKDSSSVCGRAGSQTALTAARQAERSGRQVWPQVWSCSSRPVPSPGPGSSALLVPLDMRTAPQGVVRPSSRASPLPEEPRTAPSGEIVLGILQIWNCSALISLLQLVCPTLAPRAGPCPAVSLGGRGLPPSSTGISQPQRKAGFTWAPSSPQRTLPHPFFSRPAIHPSFLSPTPGVWPRARGTRI